MRIDILEKPVRGHHVPAKRTFKIANVKNSKYYLQTPLFFICTIRVRVYSVLFYMALFSK